MTNPLAIRQAVRQMLGDLRTAFTGTVLEVDLNALTATVQPDDDNLPELPDVRLLSRSNLATGVILVPTVGSACTVLSDGTDITNASFVLVNATELDAFVVRWDGDNELRLTTDGSHHLRGSTIELGNSQLEPAVKGDTLKSLLDSLFDELIAHTHPTALGPSGPPTNVAQLTAIKAQLSTILSAKVILE
jgi:hypothetical protein